jgi:hypothetical protein
VCRGRLAKFLRSLDLARVAHTKSICAIQDSQDERPKNVSYQAFSLVGRWLLSELLPQDTERARAGAVA